MMSDKLELIESIAQAHFHHKVVVLATGVFDVLHIEHLRFLHKAKQAGDILVVGIETDSRVREIKGGGRPINGQTVRLEQLEAIKYVDDAFILPKAFSTQTEWENLMQALKPDIYAVSSHSTHQENKRRICEKYGVTFKVVHDFSPNHSSTQIIDHLKKDL